MEVQEKKHLKCIFTSETRKKKTSSCTYIQSLIQPKYLCKKIVVNFGWKKITYGHPSQQAVLQFICCLDFSSRKQEVRLVQINKKKIYITLVTIASYIFVALSANRQVYPACASQQIDYFLHVNPEIQKKKNQHHVCQSFMANSAVVDKLS